MNLVSDPATSPAANPGTDPAVGPSGEPTVGRIDPDPAEARASEARSEARRRLEARREFISHVVAYLVINGALVALWALSGGYFWPAWVLATWGAAVVIHAYEAFLHRPVTELDVDRELRRRQV